MSMIESRCLGSRLRRVSLMSRSAITTCAAVTLVPNTRDQRFATASKMSTGSPYSRRRRLTRSAAWSRKLGPVHLRPPFLRAQSSSARASASLSSTGSKPERPDRGDHGILVGVASAGDVTLDRPDRHASARDLEHLRPSGEMAEKCSVGLCCALHLDARVPPRSTRRRSRPAARRPPGARRGSGGTPYPHLRTVPA